MYPYWIKAQKKNAKECIKAAMYENCYDDTINYDSLVDFCKVAETAKLDELRPIIKDLQRQYKTELEKTSNNLESALNAPIDVSQNINGSEDQNKKSKKKVGRPNKGLTKKHCNERNYENKLFRDTKQPNDFNNSIIERVCGEIVHDEDIKQFEELYKTTVESLLDEFMSNNPELAHKHPYTWYKKLLLIIRSNTPKITANDLDKCIVVWDTLSALMDEIGLYITYETFQKVTSIYRYQLKKNAELSPKYADFNKKIDIERDSDLLNELQYNPYNQTNKMFIAKVHGIVEQNAPKQIEVHHDIRNYDSLPMFGSKKSENM